MLRKVCLSAICICSLLGKKALSQPLDPGEKIPNVKIKQVKVMGNTVLTQATIEEKIAPFIGQKLSVEDLLKIRSIITDLYVQEGYSTSGAFLPPQKLVDGTVEIQVIEGSLEKIEVKGLKQLGEKYVRDRIYSQVGTPLNVEHLETALEELQQSSSLENVEAELIRGSTPGQSVLRLELSEVSGFNSEFSVDNARSPSIGEVGGTANVAYQNLWGFGDRYHGSYNFSEGSQRYQLGASFPFNVREGIFSIDYTDADSEIIEDAFSALDIQAEYSALAFNIRQPIFSSPTEEVALGISAERIESQTSLQDVSFPFVEGLEDGQSKLSVLRFVQDWAKSSTNRFLTLESQFSLGIDAFDSTITPQGVDSIFWSWKGQFQWVESLNDNRDLLILTRIGAQITPDTLLPIEQFAIGGLGSVRGYRQNQQVADNGIVGSVELQIPLIRHDRGWGQVQFAPFLEAGTVWNNQSNLREVPDSNTLASVGLGLRWQFRNNLEVQLDYGIPLIDLDRSEDSLAGGGFHFRMQSRLIRF